MLSSVNTLSKTLPASLEFTPFARRVKGQSPAVTAHSCSYYVLSLAPEFVLQSER